MNQSSEKNLPARKKVSLLSRTLSWPVHVFAWLLVSLLISIVIEWIGLTWIWDDEGVDRAKRLLLVEYAYLNSQAQYFSEQLMALVLNAVNISTGMIERFLLDHYKRYEFYDIHLFNYTTVEKYVHVIPDVFQIFMIRLMLISFSLPAFLFVIVFCMIDGLVERDLRRWGGGRESSTIFSLAINSLFPSLFIIFFIYLSLPFSINPSWFIIPSMLIVGVSTRIACSRLKKYY